MELTKEEILYKHHEWTSQSLEQAMDEYAKQQCILFIEWSARNGWQSYVDEDRWINLSDGGRVVKSTKELYDEFISKPKQ